MFVRNPWFASKKLPQRARIVIQHHSFYLLQLVLVVIRNQMVKAHVAAHNRRSASQTYRIESKISYSDDGPESGTNNTLRR